MPKQLLALHGEHTMIQETVLRAALPGVAPPAFAVQRQPPFHGRRADAGNRHQTVRHRAGTNGAQHRAGSGGIAPTAPETGYGYIQRSEEAAGGDRAFRVKRFVEKPDAKTAAGYVASGDYFWNGGMFVFRADSLLAEMEVHAPGILPKARTALEKSRRDLDFIRLDADSFSQVENISLDYAVMEKTERAAVVPCDCGWSDVGSWSSLWEIQPHDEEGNVFVGDVMAEKTHNSFVRCDKRLTALVGVNDLVVVNTKDAVLVADKGHAQEVKAISIVLRRTAATRR